ncbi:MAG: hypothetical protein AAFU03_06045, partial [Bacteroidota bacterium]
FLIQLFYKSIWLLSFVLPQIASGKSLPPSAGIIIAIFLLLIVEVILFLRPADFELSLNGGNTDSV